MIAESPETPAGGGCPATFAVGVTVTVDSLVGRLWQSIDCPDALNDCRNTQKIEQLQQ